MLRLDDLAALRRAIREHRHDNEQVALVPTMGGLHAGHLRLVQAAREYATTVVVSIYVNPLQFGRDEDLDNYPRTLDADCRALEQEGVDIVFMPDDQSMYLRGMDEQTKVVVPGLSDILCGKYRPGHFVGVTTVVNRLFNMVQPDVAVFGNKDYQQLTIIRRMVDDLAMPVSIVGVDTVREHDGLAMSSRNRYLTTDERRVAPELFKTLQWAANQLRTGDKPGSVIETEACERLRGFGFAPDYFSVLRQTDLSQPESGEKSLVILTAATLGAARLIDNIRVERDAPG